MLTVDLVFVVSFLFECIIIHRKKRLSKRTNPNKITGYVNEKNVRHTQRDLWIVCINIVIISIVLEYCNVVNKIVLALELLYCLWCDGGWQWLYCSVDHEIKWAIFCFTVLIYCGTLRFKYLCYNHNNVGQL